MRNVDSSEITKNIKEMCIEANHFLAPDMERVFKKAKENEESKLGCQILEQLDENLKIAAEDMIPICHEGIYDKFASSTDKRELIYSSFHVIPLRLSVIRSSIFL